MILSNNSYLSIYMDFISPIRKSGAWKQCSKHEVHKNTWATIWKKLCDAFLFHCLLQAQMLRQGHDPLTINNRAINESVTHFPFCLLCKRLRDFAVGSNGFAGTAEPENHKSAWRIWWRLANNFFVYFCKQFIAPPEKRDREISIFTYHKHLLILTSLLGPKKLARPRRTSLGVNMDRLIAIRPPS